MLRPSGWIAVLVLVLASACDADSVVEVGIVHFYGESDAVVEAPASVSVGERFAVTVNTYGGGCHSAELLEVDRAEGSVELVPYDRVDVVHDCTQQLVRLPHTAEIEFSSSGPKTLTVRGRLVDQQSDTLIRLTQSLMVEP